MIIQKENFAMSLLYSDPNGNLASSSNIDANSINVIGYGDIRTKMEALESKINGIINAAESRLTNNINAQNTNITNQLNKHNVDVNAKIGTVDTKISTATNEIRNGVERLAKNTAAEFAECIKKGPKNTYKIKWDLNFPGFAGGTYKTYMEANVLKMSKENKGMDFYFDN